MATVNPGQGVFQHQEELQQKKVAETTKIQDELTQEARDKGEFNNLQAFGANLDAATEYGLANVYFKAKVLEQLGDTDDEKLSPEQILKEEGLNVPDPLNRRQIEFVKSVNKDSDEKGERAWRAFTDFESPTNTAYAAAGFIAGLVLQPENYIGGVLAKPILAGARWMGVGAAGFSNYLLTARAIRWGKRFSDSKVVTIPKKVLGDAETASQLTNAAKKLADTYQKTIGRVATKEGVVHGSLNVAEIELVLREERKFDNDLGGGGIAKAVGFFLPVLANAGARRIRADQVPGRLMPIEEGDIPGRAADNLVNFNKQATKQIPADEAGKAKKVLTKEKTEGDFKDHDLAETLVEKNDLTKPLTKNELDDLLFVASDPNSGPLELATAKGLYTLRRVDLALDGKLIYKINETLYNFAKAGVDVIPGRLYEDLLNAGSVARRLGKVLGVEVPEGINDIEALQVMLKHLEDSDIDVNDVVEEFLNVPKRNIYEAINKSGPDAPEPTTSGTAAKKMLKDDELNEAPSAAELIAARGTKAVDTTNQADEVVDLVIQKAEIEEKSVGGIPEDTLKIKTASSIELTEKIKTDQIQENIDALSKSYDEQAATNRAKASAENAQKERALAEAEEAKKAEAGEGKKAEPEKQKDFDDMNTQEKIELEKKLTTDLNKAIDDFVNCVAG